MQELVEVIKAKNALPTIAGLTVAPEIDGPVVEVAPVEKKKKKAAKKKKKNKAEALLDDDDDEVVPIVVPDEVAQEPVQEQEPVQVEREEVIPEVEVEVVVTLDEVLAEAQRNMGLMGDDKFLRDVLQSHGYEKFPEIDPADLGMIYSAIKEKNDG